MVAKAFKGTRAALNTRAAQAFDISNMGAGLFGFYDATNSSSTRTALYTVTPPVRNSCTWEGWIRGTEALLRGAGGSASLNFRVSVGGGPWIATILDPAAAGGHAVMFRGLDDDWHFVRIRAHESASGNAFFFNTGMQFRVTGLAPKVVPIGGTKWMITDPSFSGQHLSTLIARQAGTTNSTNSDVEGGGTGSQAKTSTSIRFRAQCGEIWLWGGEGHARYSIDGGALTAVTLEGTTDNSGYRYWRRLAVGLDAAAEHDYFVVPGDINSSAVGATLGVMIDGAVATFGTHTARPLLMQYGDSITYAIPTATQTNDYSELYKIANTFDYVAANCGIQGQTTAELAAGLATFRAYRGVVEDVAIIAIGRNDWGSDVSADYTTIINDLLTAGVGTIICRGTKLGDGGGGSTTTDNSISAAVTGVGDPNVHYVSTAGWSGIAFNDGTHPTAAGYETMADYAITDYAAYL